MGNYYNPPLNVKNEGRQLAVGNYEYLISQLKENEVLVGLFDRGIFMNAPHLYNKSEYDAFMSQVDKSITMCLGFYAVPKTSTNFDYPPN